MARSLLVQCLLVLGLAVAQGVARNHCHHDEKPCGNICYSPGRHEGCCNNEVIFDTHTKVCCGGNTINKTTEICCEGRSHHRVYWKNGGLATYDKCCGGVPHDDQTHECCEGYHHHQMIWDVRVKQVGRNYDCCNYRNGLIKVIDANTEKCPEFCAGVQYNQDQNICCQGRLFNYSEGMARNNASCCNGSPYNIYRKSCCFDQYLVAPKKSSEICCANSTRGKIDANTQLCCASGPLRKTSASQKCCHDTVFDSVHQGCCHNSALNTSASFNLATSICCGGNVVPKATKCCGGRWILQDGEVCCPRGSPIRVSDSQQKCCDGDYGRQLYNPRSETCTDGIVASRWSCGGPGKICCQGVEHDSRDGEVRCCLPGSNSYFTRNQTCCFGRVYDGTNLPCCGEHLCNETTTCPESFNTSCGSGCLTNGQTICCGGQVTPFPMGPNRRRCCSRVTYNGSTHRCVNGLVVKLKMCPAQRCGGMLKGGIGCRSTNDSVLVFEGIAKNLRDQSTVTFRNVAYLAKCGPTPPKKTAYPKHIDYEIPEKCKCNLKNGKRYIVVIRSYQQNQLQNQIYRLGTKDLVLKYSLENLVRIKQKNPASASNRRKSV